jgi:type IV fimbrial biogenesis protein FimT
MGNKLSKNLGFTLMELMITVSIAGILTGLAVPSFSVMIKNSRLTTYANEFVTSLNLARSEAVKRGMTVTVRKVDNDSSTKLNATANWEDGWDVFTDADSDGKFEAGDVLIKTNGPLQANYTFRGNTLVSNFVRYLSTGAISGLGGSFVICENSDADNLPQANTSKLLRIITTGRIRVMPDVTPSDGIPNTNTTSGSNIGSCMPPF